MTEEEIKIEELKRTATVSDFISYLRKNFKDSDKICYIDCVEGMKYDATPILKSDLGNRFFKYVKSDKERLVGESKLSKDSADDYYRYVNDSDVIVV